MDLTTAIVTTIQAIAWPAAVFGGAWLLRRDLPGAKSSALIYQLMSYDLFELYPINPS